jgi:signal transduction histidine kinase
MDDLYFLLMANSVLQHPWLRQWSKWIRPSLTAVRKTWRTIIHPHPVSLEYRKWRDRLIWQRLWLGITLATAFVSIQGIAFFYEMFINPEDFLKYLEVHKRTHLLELYHQEFFLRHGLIIGLLGLLILFCNNAWVRKHPALLLVSFPWVFSFIPEMVLGAFLRIPYDPSIIMFMGQAAILPIYWRLHLVAQIVPLAFFFIVYPLIGLGTFGGHSIYSSSNTVQLILVCIICEVSVYLYEQSKQSELEANRRLKLCIHAITHDLRTPVMGSLMLLESIQQITPEGQPVQIRQDEMSHLVQGYDRLLGLMNTLLDNQALSQSELILKTEPSDLSTIATTILQDFQPTLIKKQVRLDNRIRPDLPAIDVDTQQIWRVLCNLIGNAINHNPPGLHLTLDAAIADKTVGRFSYRDGTRSLPMLKVSVQDNGVGISPAQQETIFEPYTRAQQSQYQPGLGLGLYICRQVVLAHGGEIGLEVLRQGTSFWFTLPIHWYQRPKHFPLSVDPLNSSP